MAPRLLQGLIGLAAATAALFGPVAAAGAAPSAGWAIEEHGLYRTLPDVTLTDEAGTRRSLAAWSHETPLLVTFAYARCMGVCQPLLRRLEAATRQLGGRGSRYRVVVVDLDPADRPWMLQAFARSQGAEGPGWSFTSASPGDLDRLQHAMGGYSRRLPGGQIDHPALVGAVRDGRLVQSVAGAEFTPSRLAIAVAELAGDFLPTYPAPGSDLRLRCFSYRPDGGGISLDWGLAVLLVPGALAAGATFLIFRRPRAGTTRPF